MYIHFYIREADLKDGIITRVNCSTKNVNLQYSQLFSISIKHSSFQFSGQLPHPNSKQDELKVQEDIGISIEKGGSIVNLSGCSKSQSCFFSKGMEMRTRFNFHMTWLDMKFGSSKMFKNKLARPSLL